MDLDALRTGFQEAGLDLDDLDPDPFVQFQGWFDQVRAAGVHEPEAVVVSTASAAGVVSSRYVLLRGVYGGGFTFFTNYESQKGHEIADNPNLSMCFPWHVLSRQVRVVGRVERTSDEVSDDYFASRARDSQLGAWASAQSTVLADRATLVERFDAARLRFEGGEVPRPPYWGGYRVVPEEIEFWQGRASRLHDRFRYRRTDAPDAWQIERLSP